MKACGKVKGKVRAVLKGKYGSVVVFEERVGEVVVRGQGAD